MTDEKDNWLNDLKQDDGNGESVAPNTGDDYLDSLENTEDFNELPNEFIDDKGMGETQKLDSQFLGDDNIDGFETQDSNNDFVPEKQILTAPEKKSSFGKAIFGAIVLGGIISAVYIGFTSDDDKTNEVVTVQQIEPLKEKPVDPKGMEIKDQDKEVFGVLTEEVEGENVERLLPIPEKPIISKKQVDKAKAVKKPVAEEKYTVEIDGVEQTESQAKKTEKQETVKQQPKKVAPKKEVKKQEPKKVEILSSWKVQIASVGSNAQAKSTFNKMVKKIPAIAKYKLFVETAKVNGKDYHRVQIVGFKDKTEATATCKTIKSKGGDCLVKK